MAVIAAGMWCATISAIATPVGFDETAQDPPLSQQQQRQLLVFGPILTNPSADIDADTRRAAAQELLIMNVPQATRLLDRGLRSGQTPVVRAVVDAIEAAGTPVPGLLPGVLEALKAAADGPRERLAAIVPLYREEGLQQAGALALDDSLSDEQRLGPISALGAFPSSESASKLIEILERGDAEPRALQTAACRALDRIAGVEYGDDPQRWREWWVDAQHLPPDRWSTELVESLTARQLTLEQEIRDLQTRLVQTYRDLYPSLSIEQQQQRLPVLLDDPLPAVRRFAVTRVDLLRRDSVPVEEAVKEKLVDRLDDPVAGIRAEAARVLDLLDDPRLAERLAAGLSRETQDIVLDQYLRVLVQRPTSSAIEPARKLLAHPVFADLAAELIWSSIALETMTDEQIRAIFTDVVFDPATPTPNQVRLRALLAAPTDLPELTAWLDGDDPTLASAVADGLARRGRRQPLLDRAQVPAIYPHAVEVIVTGTVDLSSLQTLAGLSPPDGLDPVWSDGMRRLASQLDQAAVLDADSILESTARAPLEVRERILDDALARFGEADLEWRFQVVQRLVAILFDLDKPGRAHDLLVGLNGASATNPGISRLTFRAAILGGRYEQAATVDATPRPWVDLLTELATDRPVVAQSLADEIRRRFGDTLSPELQTAFDSAVALIPSDAVTDNETLDAAPTEVSDAQGGDTLEDGIK